MMSWRPSFAQGTNPDDSSSSRRPPATEFHVTRADPQVGDASIALAAHRRAISSIQDEQVNYAQTLREYQQVERESKAQILHISQELSKANAKSRELRSQRDAQERISINLRADLERLRQGGRSGVPSIVDRSAEVADLKRKLVECEAERDKAKRLMKSSDVDATDLENLKAVVESQREKIEEQEDKFQEMREKEFSATRGEDIILDNDVSNRLDSIYTHLAAFTRVLFRAADQEKMKTAWKQLAATDKTLDLSGLVISPKDAITQLGPVAFVDCILANTLAARTFGCPFLRSHSKMYRRLNELYQAGLPIDAKESLLWKSRTAKLLEKCKEEAQNTDSNEDGNMEFLNLNGKQVLADYLWKVCISLRREDLTAPEAPDKMKRARKSLDLMVDEAYGLAIDLHSKSFLLQVVGTSIFKGTPPLFEAKRHGDFCEVRGSENAAAEGMRVLAVILPGLCRMTQQGTDIGVKGSKPVVYRKAYITVAK